MKNRKRNPLLIPAAIGALFGAIGCAHFQPRTTPDAPESIGTLTPSETHVASAPIHATTDFGHAEIIETAEPTADDAGPVEMTVAPVAKGVDASAPAVEETPDIAPKNAHGF